MTIPDLIAALTALLSVNTDRRTALASLEVQKAEAAAADAANTAQHGQFSPGTMGLVSQIHSLQAEIDRADLEIHQLLSEHQVSLIEETAPLLATARADALAAAPQLEDLVRLDQLLRRSWLRADTAELVVALFNDGE